MLEMFSLKKFLDGFKIFTPVKFVKLIMSLLPILIIGLVLWKLFLEPKLNQQQRQIIDLRGASNFTLDAGQEQKPPIIPKRFGWVATKGGRDGNSTLWSIEIGKDFW